MPHRVGPGAQIGLGPPPVKRIRLGAGTDLAGDLTERDGVGEAGGPLSRRMGGETMPGEW